MRSETGTPAGNSLAPGRSRGSFGLPPPVQGYTRPDKLNRAKGPRALEEAVDGSQKAGKGKSQSEDRRARLQRVEDNHRRNCKQAKECK